MNARDRQLLGIDRTFCHDALVTTVLRLHSVLGAYVLLAEYIWMSRVLPLLGRRRPEGHRHDRRVLDQTGQGAAVRHRRLASRA